MGLDWSTFLLELFNFLILIWILKRFLYAPVKAAIEARRERVESVLAQANAIQAVPSRTICLRGKTLPSTIYAVEDVALEYRLAIDGLVEEMIGHRSAA